MSIGTSRYNLENLPAVLLKAFEEKIVYTPSGDILPLNANVTINESLALYSTVRHLQPTVSLEVGFANGISTLAILQALADNGKGIHHVIDPFQAKFGNAGLEMVRRAGLESYCEFHETFVENIVPNLPEIQFAFIDGSHLFDFTLVEFVLADKKLAVGGMIGLHDLWMPSLRSVVSYVLNNRKYQIISSSDASPMAGKKYTTKQHLKRSILSVIARFPKSEKIFHPELLARRSHPSLDNLTIMRKLEQDSRDWRFHNSF